MVEPRTPPLEEIREKMETALRREKLEQAARSEAERLREELVEEGGDQLAEIAAREKIEMKTSEPFTRHSFVDEIGSVKTLQGPIDILFLDADKSGYLDYLDKLLPLLPPGGLVAAHNMNATMADPKYVEAITSNPGLETIFLNKSFLGGVGVTLKKRPHR